MLAVLTRDLRERSAVANGERFEGSERENYVVNLLSVAGLLHVG